MISEDGLFFSKQQLLRKNGEKTGRGEVREDAEFESSLDITEVAIVLLVKLEDVLVASSNLVEKTGEDMVLDAPSSSLS